ncbi:MAG: lysophospholipid acyltransferase family protein [Bacteroidota bacterium]
MPVPSVPTASRPPLRPTVLTRLGFLRFGVVTMTLAFPLTVAQVITHQFRPTARNFQRWANRWGRWTLALSGFRLTVHQDLPLDPDQPYVFVANHQNWLDIMLLLAGIPEAFGFVAKAETQRIPFIGLALQQSPSIFLDRSDPRRAVASLQEAGERIRQGNSVLIFPEGRRSHSNTLQPFKKGAFQVAVAAGVPLVPVTIHNSYEVLNEKMGAARSGHIYLTIGTPIPMADCKRRDLPKVMATVHEIMRATLEARP